MTNLPTKLDVPITSPVTEALQNVENGGGLGWLWLPKLIGNVTILFVFDRNYTSILYRL